ncbi:MAG TPA: DMT family transporter [Thermoanaerobaculia bacterium]|nr:DMT family transporter [Thermoanaerobaculia bacterium]
MKQHTDNLRGSLMMLVAVGSFSLMDAGLKTLSSTYGALQVAALRGLASLPLVLIWIRMTGGFGQVLRARLAVQIVRGLIGIGMLTGFIYGVRWLPLSEAYTIFFVAPLLITIFAALILKERIEWQRWAAIATGLCGVLIVLRPAGAHVVTLAGLAVLAAALGYALAAILVRILGRTDTTQSMVFWMTAIVGGGSALLAIPRWRSVAPEHWIVIAGIAVTGTLGQWAITEAFRIGESSFIAPFEYSALAWGVGLDWLLWQKLPEARAFAGAAVIIASGIYLMRREKKVEQLAHVEPHHAGG